MLRFCRLVYFSAAPMSQRARPLIFVLVLALIAGGIVAFVLRKAPASSLAMASAAPVTRADFTAYPAANPARTLELLFIHHSCGGQLLSAPGPDVGASAIYQTHSNAGGLREMLQRAGYVVHEASYGSRVGEKTDIFDWPQKFRTQMEEILTCAHQDDKLPEGKRNQVVVFKSCYPNNDFIADGVAPGNPAGPELTYWNASAAYQALLPEFRKHPDVLFVCMTAPALAEYPDHPLKRALKRLLGRYKDPTESGRIARTFNNWLAATDGWLSGYELKNVVVFDYYDVLTKSGATNFSAYCTRDGRDSHPSAEGNRAAAEAFMPLLNRAVRRAGLTL